MPRRYQPSEVEKIAVELGWRYDHHTGSHAIYSRTGGPRLSIPEHRGELAQGTLGSIIRRMGLTRREFDRIAGEVL